jgi:DnaK suppressor protein
MDIDPAPDQAPEEAAAADPEEAIDVVDLRLHEVEAALARLDDGTYGTCQECGGVIEDHRLAESPTTQACTACASAPSDGRVDATPVAGAAAEG